MREALNAQLTEADGDDLLVREEQRLGTVLLAHVLMIALAQHL